MKKKSYVVHWSMYGRTLVKAVSKKDAEKVMENIDLMEASEIGDFDISEVVKAAKEK